MIRIQITKDSTGSYRGFTSSGHADYAQSGQDIVCAAASAILINTLNCLLDLTEDDVRYDVNEKEGGYMDVRFPNPPGEKAAFLIDCMIEGLEWLRLQTGGAYLRYEIKEVKPC